MRHLSCDPGMELIGQAALSFINNVQSSEIHPYLVKYGLTNVQPDQWYPASKIMDLMNDMAHGTNLTSNLVAIGMEIATNMVMPPEMEHAPLVAILEAWDVLYHMQHRNLVNPGVDIGYVKLEKVTENHYTTIHRHLYPDDMTYGLAYGMAKRFLPKGTHFKVKYDSEAPNRDQGGSVTIIHIMWD